jgi:hypothetical protein
MPTEWQRFQRNLSSARREIIKAVEHSSAVDLRPGHIAEARRRTHAILDELDALDRALEEGTEVLM